MIQQDRDQVTEAQAKKTPDPFARKRKRLGSEESVDDDTEQVEQELEVVKKPKKKKGKVLEYDKVRSRTPPTEHGRRFLAHL